MWEIQARITLVNVKNIYVYIQSRTSEIEGSRVEQSMSPQDEKASVIIPMYTDDFFLPVLYPEFSTIEEAMS